MSITRIDSEYKLEMSITKIDRQITEDRSFKRHDEEWALVMSMRTINSEYFNAKYWQSRYSQYVIGNRWHGISIGNANE